MVSAHQLLRLQGSWAGAEEIFATAWTASGTSHAVLELAVGPNSALLLDYVAEHEQGRLTGHGIVVGGGWWWFDSYGFVPTEPGTARWDEGRLVLERSSPRGRTVTTLELVDGKLEHRIYSAVPTDPQLRPLMRGSYMPTHTRSDRLIGL